LQNELGESRNSNLSLGQTIKSHNFNRSFANKLGYGNTPKITKKSFGDDQSGRIRSPDFMHTAIKGNETEVSTRTQDIYMAISEKK
jgi:hypothetical protein